MKKLIKDLLYKMFDCSLEKSKYHFREYRRDTGDVAFKHLIKSIKFKKRASNIRKLYNKI